MRGAVGLGLALSLSLVTSDLALRLHATSGTRGLHYGATLSNQIEVARSLARYHPDSPLSVEVLNYRLFPHALSLLRPLCGVPSDPAAPGSRCACAIAARIRAMAESSSSLCESREAVAWA